MAKVTQKERKKNKEIAKQIMEHYDINYNDWLVVGGTDPDSLDRGVGHLSNSVFSEQREQILLSGHRDTVFRDFGELETGDQFVVNMPYGTFIYEIRETEIVPEDDTSVIRDMGEEVLVVTTCYPFHYIGGAPERFVTYAYPVTD